MTIDGYSLVDAEAVGSGSFAGANADSLEAYTEAGASIYSNFSQDSSEALFTLATSDLALPPPSDNLKKVQGAFVYSTRLGVDIQSSMHALSTNADSATNLLDLVESVTEEESGTIVDTIFHISPTDWNIDVLPTPGEKNGRPTRISIDTVIGGYLTATGAGGAADASWLVVVNQNTTLLSGSVAAVEQPDPLLFAAAATHDFVVPLGDSFKLRFLWELSVTASDVSASAGEFTAAAIAISATIIPEPSCWLIFTIGVMSLQRRRLT